MSQNLVSLVFSEARLQTVDEALRVLETELVDLVALTAQQRRRASKMGAKSESFCRQTLGALSLNPHVVPDSIGLPDAQADLTALDQLRPLIQRLARLSERAADTEFALGSDVMAAALKGYALLKLTGQNQGLEGLRKTLGARFSRSRATAVEPESEASVV